MVYRYQPLYEDPEYYGDDAEDQYYEPEEEDEAELPPHGD